MIGPQTAVFNIAYFLSEIYMIIAQLIFRTGTVLRI